jgi:hypothetical protein
MRDEHRAREIGTCWKEEPRWSSKIGQWKVQFPKGIGTTSTKREAMAWVDNLIKEGFATEDKADFFQNVRGRN